MLEGIIFVGIIVFIVAIDGAARRVAHEIWSVSDRLRKVQESLERRGRG